MSRRDFAKKSILAIAGLGTASMIGYGVFNRKKIRTANNMLRMGHCAPSVMQTLLEMNGIQNTGMVLYAGAMAGGIAGSDMECGGLTAPLMFLGYQNDNLSGISQKLDLINKARSYVNEFNIFNGSTICNNIRNGGLPACRKVIYNFNRPFSAALSNPDAMTDEAMGSCSLLIKAFDDNKFHCTHSVLNNLNGDFAVKKELLDSSWIFIGGIAMLNRTCGALTAGVMALGSGMSRIEKSYSRVARMNRLLRDGSNDAMNEEINNFNLAINKAEKLGQWFRNEFGHTSCRDIWGYDFSKMQDAESYVSGQCTRQCDYIAGKVAEKVNMMI